MAPERCCTLPFQAVKIATEPPIYSARQFMVQSRHWRDRHIGFKDGSVDWDESPGARHELG